MNHFLRFDGDLMITLDGLNHTVSGTGKVFIDNIPRLGQAVLFTGNFNFTLDGGAALTKFIRRSKLGKQLQMAGLEVEIENIGILSDGVKISGKLVLPKKFLGAKVEINSLTVTRSSGLDLSGSLTLPTLTLPGNVKLRNVNLAFDTGAQMFSGRGTLVTELLEISPAVTITMGCLDSAKLEIESRKGGIPIFSSGLAITGGNIEVNNLCTGPFSITLGVDISTVDPIISRIVKLDNLQITYTVPRTLIGRGSIQVYDKDVAVGEIGINNPTGVYLKGELNLIDIIVGRMKMAVAQKRITGEITGAIQIPKKGGFPYDMINKVCTLPCKLNEVTAKIENDRISASALLAKRHVKVTATVIFQSNNNLVFDFGYDWSLSGFLQLQPLARQEALMRQFYSADVSSNKLEGQGLLLEATRQTVPLPKGLTQVAFRITSQNPSPLFNLIRPDGVVLTPATTDPQTIWLADDSTTAFYLIDNPIEGNWIVETTDSPTVLDLFIRNAEPTITLTTSELAKAATNNSSVTTEAAAKIISIQWTAADSDDDAQISLFYDTDDQGSDGINIIDGLKVSDTNKSYAWDTKGVPSGEYYVYAMISDGKNTPVVAYGSEKIIVDNPDAPAQPKNLLAQPFENAGALSWTPNSEPNLSGYIVHYTSNLSETEYENTVSVGVVNNFKLVNLEPNVKYRVAITAINDLGNASRYSEPQYFTTSEGISPNVQVTSPDGGETLTAGRSYAIQWSASDDSGIETQQILLSTDGGATYPNLLAEVGGDVRGFVWDLPSDLISDALRIRVIAADLAGNINLDDSDSTFSSGALAPQLSSLVPGSLLSRVPNQVISLEGDNFYSGAVVIINGQRLVTQFISDTLLIYCERA